MPHTNKAKRKMKIVNPLYDGAFKYLMDNEQIAKSVLSIILDQSIISLQSKPTELSVISGQHREASRYDFKAVIRNAQNEEQSVLIELQKYKTPNPIGRFRDYLAANYKKEETIINAQGQEVTQALPIITIYILGYNITKSEVLALKVDRTLRDIIWNERVNETPDFVELLTHSSIILQVDAKPTKFRNTRLERFIRLFSQKLKNAEANYFIDIDIDADTKSDNEMAEIVDCLNRATLDEAVVRSLKYEQSLAEGILGLEREVADLNVQIDLERKEKELERQQREAAEEQAKADRKALISTIKEMAKAGLTTEQIAQFTRKSPDEIRLTLSE